MAKIKQLSPLEAQKIAAGEVVERPANVVKELIENALDAGATEISLFLEDGGRKLIRIVDNGYGMSPEDAKLSILHHATSKLTSIADLETIATFGFRGEALSSIASVSKMMLTTKEASEPTGITLTISEGTITAEQVAACNTGTDIAIHDLFFTVPARRKFLKTKETEWRTIVHLFHALALAYKDVSFKLTHDERLVYNLPRTSLLTDRITQLFEPALAKHILPLTGAEERMNLSLTGAITDHTYSRFDRNQIFVYVNQRWIKNYKLAQAVIKGYQHILQPQKYPAGVLFITLDPSTVDINIHPRKEEIQFLHPRLVEDLIAETVQKALEQKHTEQLTGRPSKTVRRYEEELVMRAESHRLRPSIPDYPQEPKNEQLFLKAVETQFAHSVKTAESRPDPLQRENEALKTVEAQPLQTDSPEPVQQKTPQFESVQYRLIGQFNTTYILIETIEGLVFVDQHAAHERILYERLKSRFESVARVRLIFPQIITLTADDLTLFEPYCELFLSCGIEVNPMSEHELVISETPVFLKNQSLEDCIKQAISVIHEYQYLSSDELKKIILERVHAQMSCKAAVKAGDELPLETMHNLIKELYKTENKLTCPHGRPTLWQLSTGEIEKKFKRDYR